MYVCIYVFQATCPGGKKVLEPLAAPGGEIHRADHRLERHGLTKGVATQGFPCPCTTGNL